MIIEKITKEFGRAFELVLSSLIGAFLGLYLNSLATTNNMNNQVAWFWILVFMFIMIFILIFSHLFFDWLVNRKKKGYEKKRNDDSLSCIIGGREIMKKEEKKDILGIPEWIQFLNNKISQRINFLYTQSGYEKQNIVLFLSIMSITIVVVTTTIIEILELEVIISLGLLSIILILFFVPILWKLYDIKKFHSNFTNKVIDTISQYDAIMEGIFIGKLKTHNEIYDAWKKAEEEIQKEMNPL